MEMGVIFWSRACFVVNIQNVRVGRKVTGFEISVESKTKISPANSLEVNQQQGRVLEVIKQAFGEISESVLENVLKNYSEKYILDKVVYTKQHAKKEKSGFYPVAYFISALRDDYKSGAQLAEDNKEEKKINGHNCAWHEKLHYLQADLGYWRRHLEYAQEGKNPSLAENAKKIIQQCEKNLHQHLLEQPKDELTSEAD